MTEWILSSSVLILIIAALRFLLKGRISLRLQYALWGLVLVRLLLPFNIGSSEISVINFLPESIRQEKWEVSSEIEVMQGGQLLVAAPENTDNSGPKTENVGVSETPNSIVDNAFAESAEKTEGGEVQEMKTEVNLSELWNVIWLLGGLLVGSVLLVANMMFAVRLKKSRRRAESMAGNLNVYCTEAVDTPCLFGLFRPAIYLIPSATENVTSLHHILEHEMTHYRHKDHIWAILRGVCLAVHWYNPLVWWAAVLSRADAELACDEATIKRLGEQERAEYGRTLIGMTCQKRVALFVTATTMTGSKSGIKERITLIVKKPKMAAYTLVTVILLAMFAVGCTFTGDTGEVEVDNDITPTVTPTVTPVPTMTETVTSVPPSSDIPTLSQVAEESREQSEEYTGAALYGRSREDVHALWGEWDGVLSGLWGEIWNLDATRMVILYYNAEGIVSEVKVVERQFPDVTITPAPTEMPIDDPTPTPTAVPTITPMVVFDVQAELDAVEAAYEDIQQKLQTDASLNQADMNTLAGECATLWEEAMDTFWNVLEPLLTAEEVKELNTEQQEWLNERDAEVQAIIEEYDGGSITGLVVGQRKAELTRERVYELADRLEEKINQIMAGPSQDYSGLYVDTQGTDVVYSELKLKLQEDGSYHTEIGIYRLTTFEGTAVQYGDILLFEDPGMRVKGNIQFLDGEAVFTVTESEFEYVTPGEGFEFYKSE